MALDDEIRRDVQRWNEYLDSLEFELLALSNSLDAASARIAEASAELREAGGKLTKISGKLRRQIPLLDHRPNNGNESSGGMDVRELAQLGGLARARKLAKKQRQAISRMGGLAARAARRKRQTPTPKSDSNKATSATK